MEIFSMCVLGLKGSTKREVNLETVLLTRSFSATKYTPATPWPVDPSFMYLVWTVLQFPANSYHMCLVQLVLKGVLSTTKLIYQEHLNTASWLHHVLGCHCPGDAAVHVHMVVATMYVFGLDNSNVFHLGQIPPPPPPITSFLQPRPTSLKWWWDATTNQLHLPPLCFLQFGCKQRQVWNASNLWVSVRDHRKEGEKKRCEWPSRPFSLSHLCAQIWERCLVRK